MKRKLVRILTILLVVGAILSLTFPVIALSDTNNSGNTEIETPQYSLSDEEDIADAQELMLITSDLMMALDLKIQLLSGEQNLITFADGTEIKMSVPSSLINQLDAQIVKLKALLIEKADAKKAKWKK